MHDRVTVTEAGVWERWVWPVRRYGIMGVGDRLIPFEWQFLCMLDSFWIADLIEVCKWLEMDEKDVPARNESLLTTWNNIFPISSLTHL